jgi:hypothetical protein
VVINFGNKNGVRNALRDFICERQGTNCPVPLPSGRG